MEKEKQRFDLLDFLLTGGVSSNSYKQLKNIIDETNRSMIMGLGAVTTIIGIALMIYSVIVSAMHGKELFYFILTAGGLIMLLVSNIYLAGSQKLVIPFLYLSITFELVFGMFLSLNVPGMPGVTICLMLTVLPFTMLDKPWRILSYVLGVNIIYLLLVNTLKDPAILHLEIANVLAVFLIDISFVPFMYRVRLHAFEMNRTLELERDTDSLTKVHNKISSEKLISDYLSGKNIPDSAFLMIDIDNFKSINDTYGHATGDKVLTSISHVISNCCRKTDIIGRFGGDEFILLLPGIGNTIAAQKKAGEIVETVRRQFITPDDRDDELIKITVSIGVALYPQDGSNCDELLKSADNALYKVKEREKNGYALY